MTLDALRFATAGRARAERDWRHAVLEAAQSHTLQEVGDVLGVSRQRVHVLLKRLRRDQELDVFWAFQPGTPGAARRRAPKHAPRVVLPRIPRSHERSRTPTADGRTPAAEDNAVSRTPNGQDAGDSRTPIEQDVEELAVDGEAVRRAEARALEIIKTRRKT